ncbi:MAG: efflux RND transporter periplasmic adaptor subunit [Planctomycetota bacterium]|nr:efflux RND transporter periplasmic adaptor subunit [Planctomycetota bacterium]
MRALQLILRFTLPLLVLGGGLAGAVKLIKSRPPAKKKKVETLAPSVEVMTATVKSRPLTIEAYGTVIPAQQIIVQSEVNGRLTSLSSQLIPGGRLKTGETLVQVDKRNYDFLVTQQEGNLARAKLELETEEGRKLIALKEWSLLNNGRGSKNKTANPLALRVPHIRAAKASVLSAQSALEQAELNAVRTTVKAPFNALILNESVDLGQFITSQTQIATLVGTDQFLVRVSLPLSQLSSIMLPDAAGQGGSTVDVLQDAGPGKRFVRKGRVLRLLGDLDPNGRLARVLVAVPNPLSTVDKKGQKALPLFLGSFVKVAVKGRELLEVVRVPRRALRQNDIVWILTKKNTLEKREVTVAWRDETSILINRGLKNGDRIITSRLVAPVANMTLRLSGSNALAAAPKKADTKGSQQ